MKSIVNARDSDLTDTHFTGPDTTAKVMLSVNIPKLLESRGIRVTGHTIARQGNRFVRRNPDFSQILITCSGRGQALLDGKWVPLPPGAAYITPADCLHAYFASPDQPWEFSWVIFERGFLRSLNPPVIAKAPFLIQTDPLLLAHALQGLYNEAIHNGDEALMESWLQLVDAHVRKLFTSDTVDPRLNRLWLKVRQRPAQPWTVEAMSEIACVSGEHLRRLCRQFYGQSPIERLTAIRMQHTEVLLTVSDCSMDIVAAEAGYSDSNALSRAFARLKGVSPSHYRRRVREQARQRQAPTET